MNTSQPSYDISNINREVRSKWGWFVALGAAFVVLGAVAFGNLIITTLVSVFYVGALMIFAAIINIAHAFQVRNWSSFFAWMLSGLLYGAAGIFTFRNPLLAASTFTLLLAFTLIASGAMRIFSSFQVRPQSGWGWMLASGCVTLVAGIIFVMSWPINALWLLGIMLAIDLTFQGISAIGFGLALKSKV